MTRLKSILRVNPIIVKEIRSRMRGPRAFITLTVILILMGSIMYAMLQIILANSRYTTVLSPQIGQNLFAALAFLELFMICAVTPSVTAGAISSEKERLTYEMLMATPLSPASILWGKLISALSYVLLLLFAAVPLASVVFIFGGVSPRDMLKVLLVLFVIAISLGILGLFMSALFGRTGRATIASFVVVLSLLLGPLFLTVLVAALRQGEPPRWILAPSPISALAAALSTSIGTGGGIQFLYILGGIFNTGVAPISQTDIPRPLYHYSIPFYVITSLILYLLAIRLVQPGRRWRIQKKGLVLSTLLVLGTAGAFIGLFLLTANRYERYKNPNALTAPTIAPGIPAIVPAQQKVVVVPNPLGETPTPVLSLPPDQPLPDEQQSQIYAAIVRQIYTKDHTFGDNPPNWPLVYLISVTDDKVGDPNAYQGEPLALTKPILTGVATQLNDLPAKITWVESSDSVLKNNEGGFVENGKGVIITFGNIHLQKDGTVQVSASLYFSSLGGAGKTYVLSQIDGVWEISGTTGTQWMN